MSIDRDVVLVDLDHVISNAFHRDPMIGNVPWDEYHGKFHEDTPLQDVIELIDAMHAQGYAIIGITARPEKWRQKSLEWMVKHQVFMHELLMRPDDAYHPAPEIKVKLVLERFPNAKDRVVFIIDDRDDVCAAFKELGITALQCHARRD